MHVHGSENGGKENVHLEEVNPHPSSSGFLGLLSREAEGGGFPKVIATHTEVRPHLSTSTAV